MAGNSITLFGSDSPTGANAYIQEAFSDITDTPSTNAGWSSTVSSNPMNNLYGNDDFPRYGAKTLWVKDLVLEPNRINWINGEPTYRVIWNEPFPSAQGYVFGNVQLIKTGDQTYIRAKSVGDGFGVGGVFARCMFLMVGNIAAAGSATGTVSVDGVSNATSVDWSNLNSAVPGIAPMYGAFVHAGANETYQIHDYRLAANQAGTVFTLAGVIVYSENPSLTIDQFPGVTYNNKTRSASSVNTTLSLPAMGGSLGGVATIWKTQIGGYSMSVVGQTTMVSACTGSSGTNLVTVTTGTGASYATGNGVISSFGSTPYVGFVQSVSTDTLTVFPTLPISVSGPIYRYFQSGPSLVINASLNIMSFAFGATEMNRTQFTYGQSGPPLYVDPLQRFYVWGSGVGTTLVDGLYPATVFTVSTGVLTCEGYFNGAEIEWAGMSIAYLNATLAVNGFNAHNYNTLGFTGISKRSVFCDAGPGWNSFTITAGASMANAGIARINMYQRNRDISASYAVLSSLDVLQSFAPRAFGSSLNLGSTQITPGLFKRTYADQLLLKGPWIRTAAGSASGATIPGCIAYTGSTTTCTAVYNYYGTAFSVLGLSQGLGGSMTLSFDNGVNQGVTNIGNILGLGSSNTFHNVSLAILGGTVQIFGMDHYRTFGEMKSLQTFTGVTGQVSPSPIPIKTRWTQYQFSSTGLGTLTSATRAWWRRDGTDIEIKGRLTAGTVSGGVTVALWLPNGLLTDGSIEQPATNGLMTAVGSWATDMSITYFSTYPILYLGALPYSPYVNLPYASGATNVINLGQPFSNGVVIRFEGRMPIAGWDVDK